MKKQISILVATLFILGFLGLGVTTVSADSENVTTTWIVPGDTSITVSYPTAQGKIEFDCDAATFDKISATGQTAGTAALRVQNDGNTALLINGSWSSEWPTNITHVNISISDSTNASTIRYGDANETVNQTWVASLGIGSTEDFWFWSSGQNVEETAGVDRTLVVYSVNV